MTALFAAALVLSPPAVASGPADPAVVARHRFLAANLARQGFRQTEAQEKRAAFLHRRPTYQEIAQGQTTEKVVALTLDDGPLPGHTERLLTILKEQKVKATFFLIGNRVDDFPSLARRIVQEGHEIGNHTYYHPNLTWLSGPEAAAEVLAASWTIERHTGFRPTLARAPGGQLNETARAAFVSAGLVNAMWSINPGDLAGATEDRIVADFARKLAPGAILLLHEYPEATKGALPRIIETARARGYRFVALSELAPGARLGPEPL